MVENISVYNTRNTIFQATVCNYNKVNFHLHKLQQKLIAIHASFYKQHFYKQPQAEIISNPRLKLAKNQAKAKQHPQAKLLLFEHYLLSSFTLSFKHNRKYSEKCTRNKCVCFNDVTWLMVTKIRLKMEKRSQRYVINRHGPKYTKYEMCLSIIMVTSIKQHLNDIWSSVHEKVK